MVRARASTLIRSPADRVFEFIAVDFFKNYRRWSPEVVRLQPLSDGPVGLGTTARQVRVDRGRRTESTFRVSRFERGRRLEFTGVSDPFQISYRLDMVDASTRLTFDFELSRLGLVLRPFEKLIRAVAQESAERVVENIRTLVEAELAGEVSDQT